ncbi:MAG: hypothetical protein CXT67_00280 [Methanobacteriota archaeon]|nr:MAG: hypothetical protein CXT67_00280 [Euryarchaeota archaeon]
MIDTDDYEGHTEGPWKAEDLFNNGAYWGIRRGKRLHLWQVRPLPMRQLEGSCYFKNEADAQLIADSPLLLAEVKRLQDKLTRISDLAYEVVESEERGNEALLNIHEVVGE